MGERKEEFLFWKQSISNPRVMLNSNGGKALRAGLLARRQVWWGDSGGHSGRGRSRDGCWERVFHRIVDEHGFLEPSSCAKLSWKRKR